MSRIKLLACILSISCALVLGISKSKINEEIFEMVEMTPRLMEKVMLVDTALRKAFDEDVMYYPQCSEMYASEKRSRSSLGFMLVNAKVERERNIAKLSGLQLLEIQGKDDEIINDRDINASKLWNESIAKLKSESKSLNDQITSLESTLSNTYTLISDLKDDGNQQVSEECKKMVQRGLQRDSDHTELLTAAELVLHQLQLYVKETHESEEEMAETQREVETLEAIIKELHDIIIPQQTSKEKKLQSDFTDLKETQKLRKDYLVSLLDEQRNIGETLLAAKEQKEVQVSFIKKFEHLNTGVDTIQDIRDDMKTIQIHSDIIHRDLTFFDRDTGQATTDLIANEEKMKSQEKFLNVAVSHLEKSFTELNISDTYYPSTHVLSDAFAFMLDTTNRNTTISNSTSSYGISISTNNKPLVLEGDKLLAYIEGITTMSSIRLDALETKIQQLKDRSNEMEQLIPKAKTYVSQMESVLDTIHISLKEVGDTLSTENNRLDSKVSELVLLRPSVLIKHSIDDVDTLLQFMLETGSLSSASKALSTTELNRFVKLLHSTGAKLNNMIFSEGGNSTVHDWEPLSTKVITDWARETHKDTHIGGSTTSTTSATAASSGTVSRLNGLLTSGWNVLRNIVKDDPAFDSLVDKEIPKNIFSPEAGAPSFIEVTEYVPTVYSKPSDDSDTKIHESSTIPLFSSLPPVEALEQAELQVGEHERKVKELNTKKEKTEKKLDDMVDLGNDLSPYETPGIVIAPKEWKKIMDKTHSTTAKLSSLDGKIHAEDMLLVDLRTAVQDGEEWVTMNEKTRASPLLRRKQ